MLYREESGRMISFFSERITVFFVKKGIVKKEERNIYKYGFELIISAIISFIIMVLIGMLMDRIIESFLFYTCFILVRTYTGGFHAETHLKCKIAFAGAQVITLLMAEILIRVSILYSIISMIICLILIARFAPIENKNKKINDHQKMKKIAFALTITLYVVGFLANYIYPKSFVVIVSSMLTVVGLIVMEIVLQDGVFDQLNKEQES